MRKHTRWRQPKTAPQAVALTLLANQVMATGEPSWDGDTARNLQSMKIATATNKCDAEQNDLVYTRAFAQIAGTVPIGRYPLAGELIEKNGSLPRESLYDVILRCEEPVAFCNTMAQRNASHATIFDIHEAFKP